MATPTSIIWTTITPAWCFAPSTTETSCHKPTTPPATSAPSWSQQSKASARPTPCSCKCRKTPQIWRSQTTDTSHVCSRKCTRTSQIWGSKVTESPTACSAKASPRCSLSTASWSSVPANNGCPCHPAQTSASTQVYPADNLSGVLDSPPPSWTTQNVIPTAQRTEIVWQRPVTSSVNAPFTNPWTQHSTSLLPPLQRSRTPQATVLPGFQVFSPTNSTVSHSATESPTPSVKQSASVFAQTSKAKSTSIASKTKAESSPSLTSAWSMPTLGLSHVPYNGASEAYCSLFSVVVVMMSAIFMVF